MTMTATSASVLEGTNVGHQLALEARVVENVAIRCDAMCLTAGTHLANAVPGLSELAGQFSALYSMLEGDTVTTATQDLQDIATSVVAIGTALGAERETLGGLITLNGALSRRITDVFTDVRLLSAMVSSVKIELASIDQEGERLEGFASNLENLSKRAQAMLVGFRDAHDSLMEQLRKTATAQSAFESANQMKLAQVASDIVTSLDVVSVRREVVATAASEIGGTTGRITMQIGQAVVALQAGDSTRQRLGTCRPRVEGRIGPGVGHAPGEPAHSRVGKRHGRLAAGDRDAAVRLAGEADFGSRRRFFERYRDHQRPAFPDCRKHGGFGAS